MPRPQSQGARCKGCDKTLKEVGTLSHRYLCLPCAMQRVIENNDQMRARSGPHWAKWRRAMALCVGGVLLDDLTANGNTEPHAR